MVGCHKAPGFPGYAVLPLLSCAGFNFLVYFGVGAIAASWKHYDFTTAFDRAVPLVPGFVAIYLGCYVFWIVNYILIAAQGKEYCMRFVTADLMSRVVCAVFFLLVPTTNVRPELVGQDIWTELLRGVYRMDAPTNLFPSVHCLVSWFCYIGIRGRENIPKAYRAFSCLFAVLVFISTQVTKQHYIVDAAGGVALGEGMLYIGFHTELYRRTERFFDWITGCLLRKGKRDDRQEEETA